MRPWPTCCAGFVPPLDKLRARTRRGLFRAASRITYDVDPRTSPAALAAFHARLRKRWVEGRDRLLADKALALASFVERSGDPRSPGRSCRSAGTSEHPRATCTASSRSISLPPSVAMPGSGSPARSGRSRCARHASCAVTLDAARARRKERCRPDEPPPT